MILIRFLALQILKMKLEDVAIITGRIDMAEAAILSFPAAYPLLISLAVHIMANRAMLQIPAILGHFSNLPAKLLSKQIFV
jgi:hypothetical protein